MSRQLETLMRISDDANDHHVVPELTDELMMVGSQGTIKTVDVETLKTMFARGVDPATPGVSLMPETQDEQEVTGLYWLASDGVTQKQVYQRTCVIKGDNPAWFVDGAINGNVLQMENLDAFRFIHGGVKPEGYSYFLPFNVNIEDDDYSSNMYTLILGAQYANSGSWHYREKGSVTPLRGTQGVFMFTLQYTKA